MCAKRGEFFTSSRIPEGSGPLEKNCPRLALNPKKPRFVPAGTKFTAVGAFDNSEQNLMNPDPSRSVPWGLQSMDEMFFGAVDWKYVDQTRYQH